jgi:hypothetical protein
MRIRLLESSHMGSLINLFIENGLLLLFPFKRIRVNCIQIKNIVH